MLRQVYDQFSSRVASKLRLNAARYPAPRSSPPPPHQLTLYEYEASPWCRLVREHMTILDLKVHIRPCPRQTLFTEGGFTTDSRFRGDAMEFFTKTNKMNGDLTFPLLVDETIPGDPIVMNQSFDILQHLWDHYGQSLRTSTKSDGRRDDQILNDARIPFPLRFLSLAGPSYMRPFPTCGVLRTPSNYACDGPSMVLHQAENCPESRLVREVLCTLELPYYSIPSLADGTRSSVPILDVAGSSPIQGASDCVKYLWNTHRNDAEPFPSFVDRIPEGDNIGRSGSFAVGAYTAFLRGTRSTVPEQSMK